MDKRTAETTASDLFYEVMKHRNDHGMGSTIYMWAAEWLDLSDEAMEETNLALNADQLKLDKA